MILRQTSCKPVKQAWFFSPHLAGSVGQDGAFPSHLVGVCFLRLDTAGFLRPLVLFWEKAFPKRARTRFNHRTLLRQTRLCCFDHPCWTKKPVLGLETSHLWLGFSLKKRKTHKKSQPCLFFSSFSTGFLNHSTVDIWGCIIRFGVRLLCAL